MNSYSGTTKGTAIVAFSLLPRDSVTEVKTERFWRRERRSMRLPKRRTQRWSGEIRDWNPVNEVWLNPPKEVRVEEQKLSKAA
jgi:hypothetical protein